MRDTVDYELYYKIKKGNMKAFQALCREELNRSWFICFTATQDTGKAATLLLCAWKDAVNTMLCGKSPTNDSARALISRNTLKTALDGFEKDEDFDDAAPPQLSSLYEPFVRGIAALPYEERCIYLVNVFGGLDTKTVSEQIGKSFEETKSLLSQLSTRAQDTDEIKKMDFAAKVRLSTEFKSPSGTSFEKIEAPPFLLTALEHEYQSLAGKQGNPSKKSNRRKETTMMKQTAKAAVKPSQKKTGAKYKKPIIIGSVVLAAVIAAVIILPKLIGSGNKSTRVTTYSIEKITYGNVTQTISGTGTLTPITKETVTSSKGGEVEKVNYKVGDSVKEDAVIAVINSEDITAPCDGILIELPIKSGDEVAVGGSVAMVMGTDGFTMNIAVDETEISSVALDQEVSFTVDAVNGDYTGKVTNISYNGSSNGGTTAFQITATVDYAEGIYPGMSASAKIVIEDSGEGLLVPVDAVKTSGDDSYVYLAPSGAEEGTVYEEDELDVSSLTKVTVETGMSDGSYMIVKSDELSEGTLIVLTKVTSTQTGSDNDSNQGNFPGGGSGFPGGMDFGDFDFGDFDPSQMPQGGGNFPGRGN